MSTVATRASVHAGGPQWRRAFTWNFGIITYLCWWFFGVILALWGVVIAVYLVLGTPQVSIMQFAMHGGLWFPFSLSIILTTTVLPAWVANGGTRRAYIRGSLLTAVATTALFAAALTGLMLLERFGYERFGWTHGAINDIEAGLTAIPGPVWFYFFGLLALYGAGTLSGLLVGVSYMRGGGWKGTFALPLTAGPILLVGAVLLHPSEHWRPWLAFSDEERPAWADAINFDLGWTGAALILLILAATAAAYQRVTSDIPISAKEA